MRTILIKQNKKTFKALVDDDCYEQLRGIPWLIMNGYAVYRLPRNLIGSDKSYYSMQNMILGVPPKNMVIDHKNRNRLDNRRCNLRFATWSQNMTNKVTKKQLSKTKGVIKNGNNFSAIIGHNNKNIYLGSYPTLEKAAQAYDKAAQALHGEFASLNGNL